MNGLQTLRIAAIGEAVTLLVLLGVAVPLKHLAGLPQATSLVGPIHGVMFLLFLWVVMRSWSEGLLKPAAVGRLVVGAMIPFGGFVNERWLKREFAREDV